MNVNRTGKEYTMKVLHVLYSSSYSGAENVVISIIDGLKEGVEGVYLSRNGSIKQVLEEKGINHYLVDKFTPLSLKMAIKEIQPDVIHAHDFLAGAVVAMLFCRIPIINHLHNNPPWLKKYSVLSFVYALSTLRYAKILSVSEAVMDEYVFSGICKKKTEVVGNPVDVKKIVGRVSDYNCIDPYEIAYLGRLSTPKNPLLFVEIVAEVKKHIPNVKACMIGDGEMRSEVENKITELHLEDNIILLGFQSNPYEYLMHAKVSCMPSIWEGFGLAAVEALALGKPVVAAEVGGLVNIVNNECGRLCNDINDYVTEIEMLLTNDDYYEEKRCGALKRANEMDNMDIYTKSIRDAYMLIVK